MPNYKTSKKYKCPYCDFKAQRGELVEHVDKVHADLIPEGYNAARAVYDSINGKNYGICMSCKQKVYKWNDKCSRYYNLCDKSECRGKVREAALRNHIKVYNKPTLLNDPEQQQKMLANRKISGVYVFTDGGRITYTGKYERNALEFLDKVLEIPSRDIQAPGPTLEYEFKGKVHKWITDIYYIPANLLIEIKDGGSNPNNRPMQEYRDKQVAKEEMVTNVGTFNYIRLTNNDFSQLLAIFADMKNEVMTTDNPKAIVRINEEVGGIPPQAPPEAYIVPYMMNNVFSGYAYGDYTSSEIIVPEDEEFKSMSMKEFNEKYTYGPILHYTGEDKSEKINYIREMITKIKANPVVLVEMLTGKRFFTYQEIFMCECFKYYDSNREESVRSYIESKVTELDIPSIMNDVNHM